MKGTLLTFTIHCYKAALIAWMSKVAKSSVTVFRQGPIYSYSTTQGCRSFCYLSLSPPKYQTPRIISRDGRSWPIWRVGSKVWAVRSIKVLNYCHAASSRRFGMQCGNRRWSEQVMWSPWRNKSWRRWVGDEELDWNGGWWNSFSWLVEGQVG